MAGLIVPEAVFVDVCVVLMAVSSVFEPPNLFMWFSWSNNDQVRLWKQLSHPRIGSLSEREDLVSVWPVTSPT